MSIDLISQEIGLGDRPRRQETTFGVQMLRLEDKGSGEKGGSTADQVSTARPEEELAELDRAQKEGQKQEEANIAALTEEFDEIQAKMDANH
nr:hypothetical protein [Tanacetum cinerariifolium]